MKNSNQFNFYHIDQFYNFTCESFVAYLYNNNEFLKRAPASFVNSFRPFLIYICNLANVFKSNNYKQTFSIFFESMQIGVNQMNGSTYDELIKIKEGNVFPKITGIYLFIFIHNFEILGMKIQRQSYQEISSLIEYYLNITYIIYYFSSFIFIAIIVGVYIYKFNLNYSKLNEMKKVFKICNKKE